MKMSPDSRNQSETAMAFGSADCGYFGCFFPEPEACAFKFFGMGYCLPPSGVTRFGGALRIAAAPFVWRRVFILLAI